jgi:hypothetical protein
MYVEDRKMVVFSLARDPAVRSGRYDHELSTPRNSRPILTSALRMFVILEVYFICHRRFGAHLKFRKMEDKGPKADDVRVHLMDHQAVGETLTPHLRRVPVRSLSFRYP